MFRVAYTRIFPGATKFRTRNVPKIAAKLGIISRILLILPLNPVIMSEIASGKSVFSSVAQHAAAVMVFVCLLSVMPSWLVAGNLQPSDEVMKHYRSAEQYYDVGVKDRAMEEMKKGLETARRNADKPGEALMLNGIYKIYYYEGRIRDASDILRRSLEMYKSLKDTANVINAYNNLALSEYSSGNTSEALALFSEALGMCREDCMKKATVLQNMADIYMESDKTSYALRLLDEAVALHNASSEKQKPDDVRSCFLILAKRAQAEIRLGRSPRARLTLDSAWRLLPGIERIRRPDALAHLSHVWLEMGDSIAAFRMMLGYEALMDSLTRENNESSLQQLLVQFDTERLQQRNEALRLKVQNRNIAVVSGILIAVLLLMLSGFLVWKLRSDRRRSRIIQSQQRDIVRYQKEAAELREREMQHEMDAQNRQLTSFAINHSAINEFHSSLAGEFAKCRQLLSEGKNTDAVKAIDACAAKCRRFDEEVLSRDFRVYFEKVHPDFFNRLRTRFPALTKNDLRLCAFLYLGMSTKEIAALICREIRSVESSRLRLRKKLDISGDTPFQEFLASITDIESE